MAMKFLISIFLTIFICVTAFGREVSLSDFVAKYETYAFDGRSCVGDPGDSGVQCRRANHAKFYRPHSLEFSLDEITGMTQMNFSTPGAADFSVWQVPRHEWKFVSYEEGVSIPYSGYEVTIEGPQELSSDSGLTEDKLFYRQIYNQPFVSLSLLRFRQSAESDYDYGVQIHNYNGTRVVVHAVFYDDAGEEERRELISDNLHVSPELTEIEVQYLR